MRVKTNRSLIDQQNVKIAGGAKQVRAFLDYTEEEHMDVMLDLGLMYARNQYPRLAEQLIRSRIYWHEFILWWNANNYRFASELTVDDMQINGQAWAKEEYLFCQAKWCREIYRPSKVVIEDALKTL